MKYVNKMLKKKTSKQEIQCELKQHLKNFI